MEEKKKVNLNISSTIILMIAALIIGITIGMYVTINMVENSENETTQTNQSNTIESSSTENTSEKEYVELDEDDDIVTEITSKYDFTTDGLIALLYKEGDFNIDTSTVPVIPNEEILAITWGLMVEPMVSDYFSVAGEEISSGDYMAYDGNGTITVSIPETVMEEYIEEIFGSSIQYTNSSFDMTTESLSPFRNGSVYTDDAVSYSDGIYTATYVEGGGAGQPVIKEYVQKILKYSDRIEIYVNTGYWRYDEDSEDYAHLYLEYDFEHEEFYNEVWSGDDDSDTSAISELHTRVYTYTLDENTGEYYLSSFDTVVDE